jgi:uncharacterized protein
MDFLPKFKLDLEKNGELYLKIKAIPGAPKTEVKAEMADGTLKIAVAAAPEKGKANMALLDFLAEEFGGPRGSVKIISGAGARVKLVKITHST